MTTLKNYGIDAIFGIPGTHNLEFYRHLAPLGIHPVTTRHEQGAGYGADGWSQLRGLPGVVITTSGPGLLNALSAAGTAYCESRPLLILSPGAPLGMEFSDIGALHETKDPTGAAGSVVQWSRRARSGSEAVALVHEAFELFRYGRPRPVHIEIPLDVLEGAFEGTDEACEAVPRRPGQAADPAAIAAAVAALSREVQSTDSKAEDSQATDAVSNGAVILAGGGSLGAGRELVELAELLQATVVTTINGKGAVPESHPLSIGSEIRFGAAQEVCNKAGTLLLIGSKVGESELWGGKLEPAGTCIRIDITAGQMDTNVGADIAMVGDAAVVVGQLLEALRAQPQRQPRGAGGQAELKRALRAEARAMAPELAEINEIIASVLPADTVMAGDSSQVTYFGTTSFIDVESGHQLLYTPAYATLGYGLPAAIGAKVAAPERPVVCMVGDGALMFAVQELMTAVEQGVCLPVICIDNGGYGEIRQNMKDRSLDPVGVDLVQPRWAQLAEGFGATGVTLTSTDELGAAVQKALAGPGTTLIHLRINGPE